MSFNDWSGGESDVDRMLYYARVGSEIDRRQTVDLNEVVANVKENLIAQISAEHVDVDSMSMPNVAGEPMLINELFQEFFHFQRHQIQRK